MKIGRFEIRSFVEQRFRLDGGTMFGVIPKSMWQKLLPADGNNLIPMTTNLFVLTAHGKNMIFDIGLGDTLSDREKKVYGTDGVSTMDSGLASIGFSPSDIHYVILTHLHTDHCGGAVIQVNGEYRPRFPNATYIVSTLEWEAATHPDERTGAVYVPARYRALEEQKRVQFIDGSTELFPGIRAVHTGGHSDGHFGLEIESEGERLFYYADIFPSVHHLRIPFVPATDVYPLQSMAVKRQLLPRLTNQNVILAFDHDINVPFGRVVGTDRLRVEPVHESLSQTVK